jgi:HK97 family phage portal protein
MLRWLFGSNETRSALDDASWWGEPVGMSTSSGVRVTQDNALQLLAVYGCVSFIADQISTLPVKVYRKTAAGPEPVASPAWLTMPTPDLHFTEWCSQVLTSLLLAGNAYLYVVRDIGGRIEALIPLDPGVVDVRRVAGRKVFAVNGGVDSSREILHIPATMLAGADVGLSPLECARQSIGVGLAAAEFGGRYFDSDGNMPGVIEAPGGLTPDEIRGLAATWRRNRSRAGKGLPGVLINGAQWKTTAVSNEQAQFLATRQWTAAEIAGQVFKVDPTDLGIPVEGSSLTYANLEQRATDRVQKTFQPWIVRIEDAVSRLLANPRYMKLNVGAYIRGDTKTRYESYQIGIGSKFMLPNEARAFEDWQPLEGGDEVVATPAPMIPEEGDSAA